MMTSGYTAPKFWMIVQVLGDCWCAVKTSSACRSDQLQITFIHINYERMEERGAGSSNNKKRNLGPEAASNAAAKRRRSSGGRRSRQKRFPGRTLRAAWRPEVDWPAAVAAKQRDLAEAGATYQPVCLPACLAYLRLSTTMGQLPGARVRLSKAQQRADRKCGVLPGFINAHGDGVGGGDHGDR
jgi:hypothetical protein